MIKAPPAAKDNTPKKKVRMRMTPAFIRARKALQAPAKEETAAAPIQLRPVDPRPSHTKKAPLAARVSSKDAAVFELLDPSTIAPSPFNPRQIFDPEQLEELVASVRKQGVRVPISVRLIPSGAWYVNADNGGKGKAKYFLVDRRRALTVFPKEIMQTVFDTREAATAALPKYEIIAGERRWRASRLAESATIRAIVETLDDIEVGELQTVENLQRADLTDIEEATGYKTMLAMPGYAMERLEAATGKKRNTIYSKLKLLDCPEEVQDAVAKGVLPGSTAEMIGRLEPELQKKAAKAILHPEYQGYGERGERTRVLPHREAQRKIEELRSQQKAAEDRELVIDQFKDAGIEVLDQKENDRATAHYSSHNKVLTGYVIAGEKCPRDPQGRTWHAILKTNPDVVPRAAIAAERSWNGDHYTSKFTGIKVYALQEANDALKAAGLWEAEGSKKAIELEEKRQAKAAEKARIAKMHADLDEVVKMAEGLATTGLIRPVIELVLIRICTNAYQSANFVAKRRKEVNWSGLTKMLDRMGRPQMVGLLAEVAACLGGYSGEPGEHHLKEALTLLRGTADVRTTPKVPPTLEAVTA